MSKVSSSDRTSMPSDEFEMLDHYDFSGGVRGRYYQKVNESPIVHIVSETDDRQVTFETIEVNAVVDGEGVLRVEGLRSLSPGEYRVVMMVEKNVGIENVELRIEN